MAQGRWLIKGPFRWVFILAMSGIALVAGWYLWRHIYRVGPKPEEAQETAQQTESTTPIRERHISFLYVGLDTEFLAEEKTSVRSDVLMVGCAALHTGEVRILSIPRDTLVDIPGVGQDKVNHAFAFGGGTKGGTGLWLSMSTVKQFLGVEKIDHYFIMDMTAVPRLVNTLGGVEINGNWLDGSQAIALVRARNDSGGDISRITRQQMFVKAMVATIVRKQLSLHHKWELLKFALTEVKTDISPILALKYSREIDADCSMSLEFMTVPGQHELIKGVSYWEPDQEALAVVVDYVFFGRNSSSGGRVK